MSKKLIDRLRNWEEAPESEDAAFRYLGDITYEAAARIEELERERDALLADNAELAAALEKASEEIRRCDYTPARSTLLVALAKVRKP